MMSVITGVVYFAVRTYMFNEALDRYLGLLLENHQEMRSKLSDVFVAVKNNLDIIENEIDQPEKVIYRLERILQVNPNFITCSVLYQPGHFPDRKQCLELIATHDSAGICLSSIENDYIAYSDRQWFKEAIGNSFLCKHLNKKCYAKFHIMSSSATNNKKCCCESRRDLISVFKVKIIR